MAKNAKTDKGAKAAKPAAPAKTPKAPKGSGRKGGESSLPLDSAPMASVGKPRMQRIYEEQVRVRLSKEFGFTNPHQVPRLTKIVLNIGLGEGAKNPKAVDSVADELGVITGQKAIVTKAKKAIANFGLRVGLPIGATVTLRGARMYEFLDRFISLTVPRIRDFRGLPTRSFDGRGNYTFGIKEQTMFPEIDYDKVELVHGMDITLVTTAGRDDLAMALLREFGWPFRGETPRSLRVA